VTEWEEFKKLMPEDFRKNMKQPILVDGRRIYHPEEFRRKVKFTAIVVKNSVKSIQSP
jgi:UDPglucose 6-dehydrogenase